MSLRKPGREELLRFWRALAGKLELSGEEVERMTELTHRLLEEGGLTYEEASELASEDLLLLAHELALVVLSRGPGDRCLEWDACPLGPGARLSLNPAAEAVLRACLEGREVREALSSLLAELGLDSDRAGKLAHVALELARRRVITGSDVASACRSQGLEGFESQAVAILKAAGAISPLLATTWPSQDVRYRTCALLALTGECRIAGK